MRTALVGCTGFVGANLAADFAFDNLYNSKNINDAYHTNPDFLVYAGIRAEKFLANVNPDQDHMAMQDAMFNIKKINPKNLVLISTIDVYKKPTDVDERTPISIAGLHPYGANRHYLENQVRIHFPEACIIRLPALFGDGLKKNFIYDYIHRIPALLNPNKMQELSILIPKLKLFYHLQENGFYKYIKVDDYSEKHLKNEFESCGFTALNFTDSRSTFQFYSLTHLWPDICRSVKLEIPLLNISTEPLNAGELYHFLSGNIYKNQCSELYPVYDFRSIYAEQMEGEGGYLYSKKQIMKEIRDFVEKEVQS